MKVTTRELKLVATFNEKTKDIEVMDIEKSDAKIETETAEKPVEQVLLLHWIKGQYEGSRYNFEGSIENVGEIPLTNIQIKLQSYSEDDELLSTEVAAVEPEVIAPGERARFRVRFFLTEKLRKYDYMFMTDTGTSFWRVSEDIFILP